MKKTVEGNMEYRYDVFISYKHADIDSAVAQGLQKKLEHYRVPREIQRLHGKKKINRVFRDQEELSVGYDLAAEIEEQLKNSEFLVVLCSRASRKSLWVAKEVDTFLKYHSPENILPILIDGEPEESFPLRLLKEGEPFAADIRADSKKATLKKLESEVYRIIAPVLYCHYDELIQRNKRYRLQRILAASITAFVLLTAFTIYVIKQNIEDRRAFMAQLLSESKILTKEAGDYMKSADYYSASRYLLQALPDPAATDSIMRQRPFYTPAAKMLTETLDIYKTSQAVSGKDRCDAMYEGDNTIQRVVMGQDESFLFAVDAIHIHMIDSKTMKEKDSYTYSQSDTSREERELQFFDQTKMVIADCNDLVCYDYAKGERVWKKSFIDAFDYILAEKEGKLYAIGHNSARLYVIDLKDGKEIGSQDLTVESNYIKIEDISEDGKKLLLHYNDKSNKQTMCVYDCDTKKIEDTFALEHRVAGARFALDEKQLIMVREMTSDQKEVSFQIALYDRQMGKYAWEKTFTRSMPNASYGYKLGEGQNRGKIIAYYGHNLAEMDLANGSVIREYPLEGAVKMIFWEDDLIRAMTSEGVIFLSTNEIMNFEVLDQSQIYGLMYWPNYPSTIYHACCDSETTYYLQTEEKRILRYAQSVADENIVHETPVDYGMDGLDKVSDLANEDYRVSLYQFPFNFNRTHFAFIGRHKKSGKVIPLREEDILPSRCQAYTEHLTPVGDLGRDYYAMSEEEREIYKNEDTYCKDMDLVSLEDSVATFLVCYQSFGEDTKYAAYQVKIDLDSLEKTVNPIYLSKNRINCKQMIYDHGTVYTCLYSFSGGLRIVKSDSETRKTEVIKVPIKTSYDIRVISSPVNPFSSSRSSRNQSALNRVFYVMDKRYAKLYVIEATGGDLLAEINMSDYTFYKNDIDELILVENEEDGGKGSTGRRSQGSRSQGNRGLFAIAEQSGIHIYDQKGVQLCKIDYEREIGEEEKLSDLFGGMSFDPNGRFIYYLAFGKIYQCDVQDGKTINTAEIPDYTGDMKASIFHYDTFSYDGGKTEKPVLDLIFATSDKNMIKQGNMLYEIYLEESDFGLIFQAKYAYDIDEETGRIYSIDKRVVGKTCHLAYFDRYSYEEMIAKGKEVAGDEE